MKGSRNRRKQRVGVARVYEQVENRRNDFLHKWSRYYVDRYDHIALEHLNIKPMVESLDAKLRGRSQSIFDAAWYKAREFIHYKAANAGTYVHLIDPMYTTQDCFLCGHREKKDLSQRTHCCPVCGYTVPRDLNAAQNILKQAAVGGGTPESTLVETRTATPPIPARHVPVNEARISRLKPGESVKKFLSRARQSRGYALDPDTPLLKTLAHLNLLDGDQPSNAAVLLFGKQPQHFLISSEVKCLHFHGAEVSKPIPSYQIYKGTVFELVDQSLDFVLSKIARSVGTRAEGPTAPMKYEVPQEAVGEAIINAIAHRDYASNASVQVMLFSDRLEVWNPGQLPPSLSPEALRAPHPSIPRNPLIAEPFFLTRYIEKAGTGTLDMIEQCSRAGLSTPEFRQDCGQFVQVLWRPKHDGTTYLKTGDQVGTRLLCCVPA